jgi:predicted enzyme related to lactoylglutathione lyase
MPPIAKGNQLVHLELNTPSLDAAKASYGGMFGWQIADIPTAPGMVYCNNGGET